jgi:potassium-transporting ATPase KdpC subunit
MKNDFAISLRLTVVMLLLCSVLYPLIIAAVGKATPGGGKGKTISVNSKVVGYENVGQKFTDDKYFWSRPSAIDYNAAGSAGSNKGPSNPYYLKIVQDRIDTFLVHNPAVKKADIPAEMVTASGSGLDPHISPSSAYLQVKRIAGKRNIPEDKLRTLIESKIEKPWFGPAIINVLKLNIALDKLSEL